MCRIFFSVLTVLFILVSCGDKNSGNDTDTVPDDDVAENTSDPEPDDKFFENSSANRFIFDFKGLINSEQSMIDDKATPGIGSFDIVLGTEELSLDGDKFVYFKDFPENYATEELAGKEYLIITDYTPKDNGTLENGNVYYNYHYLTMGFSVSDFAALKKDNKNEMKVPEPSWISFYSYFVVARENGQYFMQYCVRSVGIESESQIFVDHRNNTSFSKGENLLFWGNITMSEPVNLTEENRDNCFFYSSTGEVLTKDEFDEEIALTGTEFSCEIPEEFFDSKGEDYIKFKYKGRISDSEVGQGYTEFAKMDLDGTFYHADDFLSGSGLTTVISKKSVYLQMTGDYSLTSNRSSEYNDLQVFIPVSTLNGMKEDGVKEVKFSAENIFNFYVVFHRTTYLEIDGQGYVKSCPIAVLDKESLHSALYFCIDENSAFNAGDEIEAAGRITVSDTDEKIGEYYPDGCICYAYGDAEDITCEDFDKMMEE